MTQICSYSPSAHLSIAVHAVSIAFPVSVLRDILQMDTQEQHNALCCLVLETKSQMVIIIHHLRDYHGPLGVN